MRQIKQEVVYSKVRTTTIAIIASKSTITFIGNSTINIMPEKAKTILYKLYYINYIVL